MIAHLAPVKEIVVFTDLCFGVCSLVSQRISCSTACLQGSKMPCGEKGLRVQGLLPLLGVWGQLFELKILDFLN